MKNKPKREGKMAFSCLERIVIDQEDDIPTSMAQEGASETVPEAARAKCKRKFDVTNSEMPEHKDHHPEINYEPPQKERCVEAMFEMSADLECPVCMTCITPPIKTCWRGHGICGHCFMRVKSCPLCSSKLNPNQNTTLDKIVSRLVLPCAFLKFGCRQMVEIGAKPRHESECHFRVLDCPVAPNCVWRGKQREMAHHLRQAHAGKCSVVDYNEKITRKMAFSDDFHVAALDGDTDNSLIVIENDVFELLVKGRRERTQHYVLQSYGNDESASKFRYRLIHTSDRGVSLTYEGIPIPNNSLLENVWQSNRCHRIPWELYENFFEPTTQDETLQIQILKNETPICRDT